MISVVAALALGLLFGWLLHKAGLTRYATIVGVYRLTDLTVLRFMLVALAVAAVLIQVAVALGIAQPLPVPPTNLLANAIGGLVFGIGMAAAGYCPGTIVAEAGEGRLDALVAGVFGLVAGALIYGLLQPFIKPPLASVGALGRVSAATAASPWLVVLVFVELVVLVLVLVRRAGPR